MGELERALAELEQWADDSDTPRPNKPATGQNNTEEETSCLTFHQSRQLFLLAESVKGCSLPDAMMPPLPR